MKKNLTKLNQETISRSTEKSWRALNESSAEDMEVSNSVSGQGVLADRSFLTDARKFSPTRKQLYLDGIDRLFISSRFCKRTVPTLFIQWILSLIVC